MDMENQHKKMGMAFCGSQTTRTSDAKMETPWMKRQDEGLADLGATFKFFTDSFTVGHYTIE